MKRIIKSRLPALVLFSVAAVSSVFAVGDEPVDTFRELATTIPFLNSDDILFDRTPVGDRSYKLTAEHEQAFNQFFARETVIDSDQLAAAFDYQDPKVRTLAIITAYWLHEPRKWLPKIRERLNDEGPSFPTLINHNSAPGSFSDPLIDSMDSKSVGDFANSIVGMYLESAGYYQNPDDIGAAFDSYWETRRNADYCPSWFRAELRFASSGMSSAPEERLDLIKAVRARIAKVPSPDRELILLSLAAPWEHGTTDDGGEHLASEQQLVDQLKQLDRNTLLNFLQRIKVSDHPEFQFSVPMAWAFGYERVARFLLKHASELFAAENADTFLEFGREERAKHLAGEELATLTSRWGVAAADLDPSRAQASLAELMQEFSTDEGTDAQDNRVIIAEAMWRHEGMESAEQICDWFFSDLPDRGAYGFGRHWFCEYLEQPEQKEILLALLVDPRLNELDWLTLKYLIPAVNKHSATTVIRRVDADNVYHPLGAGHYHWDKEKALKEYPDETAALEAHLKNWCERLREFAESQ